MDKKANRKFSGHSGPMETGTNCGYATREMDAVLVRVCNPNGFPTEFERLLFSRGVCGFELWYLAEEIGGDTVGRLGMCVHAKTEQKPMLMVSHPFIMK